MNMNINNNAYPDPNPDNHDESFNGLSKKELFAAMAMQGLLSNLSCLRKDGFRDHEIAEFAIYQAMELCKQLGLKDNNQ